MKLARIFAIGFAILVACASSRLGVNRALIGGELYQDRNRRNDVWRDAGVVVVADGGALRSLDAQTLLFRGGRLARAEPWGTCKASEKIRVIDGAGHPVAGAWISAHLTESEHAIEETLAVYEYASAEVQTDVLGEARVCAPDALKPEPWLQGIGGGFTVRTSGELHVRAGERQRVLRGPFSWPLTVDLR